MMGCSDEPVGYERPEELLIRHHIGVDEEPGSAASFAHPISLAAALLANALLRVTLNQNGFLGLVVMRSERISQSWECTNRQVVKSPQVVGGTDKPLL